MNALSRFFLGLAICTVVAVPQAFACGPEENMTHMGQIAHLDAQALTLTLLDAQTGKPLVFSITADQLKTVHENMQVAIRYSQNGNALVADQIQI